MGAHALKPPTEVPMKKQFILKLALLSLTPLLQADEPAMGLLLTCSGSSGEKTAELSTEKDSEGTRISLWVYSYNEFHTTEYRGSDARARSKLANGEGGTFLGELLSESGRRDTITVEAPQEENSAQIKIESAQRGSRTFNCHYVD